MTSYQTCPDIKPTMLPRCCPPSVCSPLISEELQKPQLRSHSGTLALKAQIPSSRPTVTLRVCSPHPKVHDFSWFSMVFVSGLLGGDVTMYFSVGVRRCTQKDELMEFALTSPATEGIGGATQLSLLISLLECSHPPTVHCFFFFASSCCSSRGPHILVAF